MKLRVSPSKKVMIKVGGGDEPKAASSGLTYDQINQWSDYVEANPGVGLDVLWKGFSAKYPKSGISYDVLKADLDKLMAGSQKVAGRVRADLANSSHTGYSFPRMVVGGKDMGRVNAALQTQGSAPIPATPGAFRRKFIPKEATEVWLDPKDNEVKFVDPESGDIMYADRSALNDPRIKKSAAQQEADLKARQLLTKVLSGK